MFDNISIAEKLPMTQEMIDLGLDSNNLEWQTKDLDNSLAVYFLQSGRLFLQKFKVEEWVEGDKKAKSWSDRAGFFKREEPYLEDTNQHGTITFYAYSSDVQGKWDCWIEYEAKFTQGNLDCITLIKFEKTDSNERKKKEQEFIALSIRKNSLWYNKYFLRTKAFRWFAFKIWYKFFNKLGSICYKLSNIFI